MENQSFGNPNLNETAKNGNDLGKTVSDTMKTVSDTMEQARNTARNASDQVWSAAQTATSTAQELAKRARDQYPAATDMIYQQGARAGEYLTRNVNDYPLTALLLAGMIGYGIAYLVHARAQG